MDFHGTSMKAPLEFGLIGVGGFGERHLEAIRALEQTGEVKLVAVGDPQLQRFPELAADLRARSVRAYDDYRDMLTRESGLQVVSIAAPIPFHFEMARKCLEHDLFVYLEKPPAPLVEQLEELIRADVRCRVAVGFQMVESIWSQQIKRWIVSGKLGDLREVRVGACWPRGDGYYRRASWAGRMTLGERPVFDGPATNALAHLVHNIMFFAGAGQEFFDQPNRIQGELYRARPIESYDVACLRGHFPSGIFFYAALTHATQEYLPYQMEIIGTKGWARVSKDGALLESSEGPRNCVESIEGLLLKSFTAFIDYVRGRRHRPPTLLRDVRGYSFATNAMLQSSGGMHDIEEAGYRRIENNHDSLYAVHGLHDAIVGALRKPQLFSELNFPWAVETPLITTMFAGESVNLMAIKSRPSAKPVVAC